MTENTGCSDSHGDSGTSTEGTALKSAAAAAQAGPMLALIRGHLRALDHTLATQADMDSGTRQHLVDIWALSERLTEALTNAHDSPRDETTAQASGPLVAVDRHVHHVVGLDLRAGHIRALIETGALEPGEAVDSARVAQVLQAILDRWSSLHEPQTRAGKKVIVDRRHSSDRRHNSPRPNSLLSYVAGTQLDRRKKKERRSRDAIIAGVTEPDVADPANLVRLTESRRQRAKNTRARSAAAKPDVLPFRRGSEPSAAAEPGVGAEHQQSGPNQPERNQSGTGQRFAEHRDRQQEVTGGGDVLQQSERRQSDPTRPSNEQDQG